MATIIAVHGTWAHVDVPRDVPASERGRYDSALQWWEAGSPFETEMTTLVSGADGPVRVERFVWSGDNSETERRAEGARLYEHLLEYEARKEPYVLVGHSHGGSIVAEALLQASIARNPLPHLKRWLTVGTPFIALKPETFFFQRLSLTAKVAWVASWMLFLMFAVYAILALIQDGPGLFTSFSRFVLITSGVMMTLPIIAMYTLFRILDARGMSRHRPRTRKRAADMFEARWRALTHAEDEVVGGLGYLPQAQLAVFDRRFAVERITFFSIIAMPLIYLLIISMPSVMLRIADLMRSQVYGEQLDPRVETELRTLRQNVPPPAPIIRTDTEMGPVAPSEEDRRELLRDYRDQRRALDDRYGGNVRTTERALRFKQRFFEEDGKPCPDNVLCGRGEDMRINSALILHLATDELSWSLGAEGLEDWSARGIAALLVPMILVPLVSILVAMLIMWTVRLAAMVVSLILSRSLNAATRHEVRRALFGNDTTSDVALGVLRRPMWIEREHPPIPETVGQFITAHSDREASLSITKFRRGIGRLNTRSDQEEAERVAEQYFTWRELVHAAYFEVPQFRTLIARIVAGTEGFGATPRFQADPSFATATLWMETIDTQVSLVEAITKTAERRPAA
jgi:pimeloyl-ACP methyl ester carboxylesterase